MEHPIIALGTKLHNVFKGMAREALEDGYVDNEEIKQLLTWMETDERAKLWPFNVLHHQIKTALKDDIISEEERQHLTDILIELAEYDEFNLTYHHTPQTPVDYTHNISIKNCRFYFTGKADFGTRKQCEHEVIKRGGFTEKHKSSESRYPRYDATYLVLGNSGSSQYGHEAIGSKIESAINAKRAGHESILIIPEYIWRSAL